MRLRYITEKLALNANLPCSRIKPSIAQLYDCSTATPQYLSFAATPHNRNSYSPIVFIFQKISRRYGQNAAGGLSLLADPSGEVRSRWRTMIKKGGSRLWTRRDDRKLIGKEVPKDTSTVSISRIMPINGVFYNYAFWWANLNSWQLR